MLCESPNFGISSNVYSTGTADWLMWIITEEILGIKSDFDGIRIKPNIPASWSGASVVKRYKYAVYKITLKRAQEKKTIVNGKPFDAEVLPYSKGQEFDVVINV